MKRKTYKSHVFHANTSKVLRVMHRNRDVSFKLFFRFVLVFETMKKKIRARSSTDLRAKRKMSVNE